MHDIRHLSEISKIIALLENFENPLVQKLKLFVLISRSFFAFSKFQRIFRVWSPELDKGTGREDIENGTDCSGRQSKDIVNFGYIINQDNTNFGSIKAYLLAFSDVLTCNLFF